MIELNSGAFAADPVSRMPQLPHQISTPGIRLMLLPPGPVDLRARLDANLIDLNFSAASHKIAVNSDRMATFEVPPQSIAFWPKDTDVRLRVENSLPGCCIEVDDDKLTDLFDAVDVADDKRSNFRVYEPDVIAADVGRIAMRHLLADHRGTGFGDPLTAEALALTIATRMIALAASPDSNPDEQLRAWS